MGLLLLRAAVGWTVLAKGAALFLRPDVAATASTWIIALLALASGALLLIGFLTPAAAALVAMGGAAFALAWLPMPGVPSLDGALATFFVTIIAAAVALLGPGAWSIDAWLFGRREIVIPHESRPPRST